MTQMVMEINTNSYHGIAVTSKSADPVGPLNVTRRQSCGPLARGPALFQPLCTSLFLGQVYQWSQDSLLLVKDEWSSKGYEVWKIVCVKISRVFSFKSGTAEIVWTTYCVQWSKGRELQLHYLSSLLWNKADLKLLCFKSALFHSWTLLMREWVCLRS